MRTRVSRQRRSSARLLSEHHDGGSRRSRNLAFGGNAFQRYGGREGKTKGYQKHCDERALGQRYACFAKAAWSYRPRCGCSFSLTNGGHFGYSVVSGGSANLQPRRLVFTGLAFATMFAGDYLIQKGLEKGVESLLE